MTRYQFFSGKGGVGKTTMACATAIHNAMEGKKTLIVTTDPASNLTDVFEQEIGHVITRIKGVENLWAMEIDPDEATREYKERIIGPFREIMPEDVIASLEENLSGPCTTEMASFDRFIDFMEGSEYDLIVFDTAPTGHTIRLLELPVDWSKHIEESAKGSGQTCLGPVQSIQDSKEKYDRATALLKDPGRTTFIFVMRPEELSLYETLRASKELETIGLTKKTVSKATFIVIARLDRAIQKTLKGLDSRLRGNDSTWGLTYGPLNKSGEIIINGILPEEVCEIEFFRRKYESQQKVIKETESTIDKPKRYMLLRDNEVKGVDALRNIAKELIAKNPPLSPFSKGGFQSFFHSVKPPSLVPTLAKGGEGGFSHEECKSAFKIERPDIDALFLPGNQTKAIFFTGKGGVGKTSISCITALYISQKGVKTLLVTTDPAAHIGEVLDVKVGSRPEKITDNLFAVMVNQQEAFQEYKEKVLGEARGKYSDDMLATMEEELNSPCTEEMAAFDKFIQYIEGRDYEVVVFDTAPTGHTLRLLDLPFDYAKQVEMMVSTTENSETKETAQNRFRDIISSLRDKERTVFSLVLYPEATPIMESYRAMLDLKEAGIKTQLVIANMVLPEEVCTNNFFRNRRKMQVKYLEEIKEKFGLPVVQFPLMQEEIKGLNRLKAAASCL